MSGGAGSHSTRQWPGGIVTSNKYAQGLDYTGEELQGTYTS